MNVHPAVREKNRKDHHSLRGELWNYEAIGGEPLPKVWSCPESAYRTASSIAIATVFMLSFSQNKRAYLRRLTDLARGIFPYY
ncbi:MAG: hypothetical protein AAGG51_03545 [Cyanobacteria bacterium P01_G01_bin.54]